MMSTRTSLTVISLVYLAQAFGIFLGARAIATGAFPGIAESEMALLVGTSMHEALAGIAFCTGMVLWFSRNLEAGADQVLKGFAIGTLGIIGVASYHMATMPVEPPIPLLVIMLGLAIYAWLSASRAGSAAKMATA
ncbi:MAG: hypothetical protein CBC74_004305 [Crocinitomicaceae bacterium TMED114]|nr:MAG: hypothetical protein CBC74_004305 [Crocinitomicaceae bacterium TMED114]|tara:strand:+ start:424 stop:831 length:408 start_codon:yes stop_codon:yes gene_type:complete